MRRTFELSVVLRGAFSRRGQTVLQKTPNTKPTGKRVVGEAAKCELGEKSIHSLLNDFPRRFCCRKFPSGSGEAAEERKKKTREEWDLPMI